MSFLDWRLFALGSALFAALTAIFGKIGVSGVPSNMATLFRTLVVLMAGGLFVAFTQEWQNPFSWNSRTLTFLILSGLATGASWFCYYHALQLAPASRVAPLDKLSVVFVILFAVAFLGEALTWKTALGGLLIAAGAVLLAI